MAKQFKIRITKDVPVDADIKEGQILMAERKMVEGIDGVWVNIDGMDYKIMPHEWEHIEE